LEAAHDKQTTNMLLDVSTLCWCLQMLQQQSRSGWRQLAFEYWVCLLLGSRIITFCRLPGDYHSSYMQPNKSYFCPVSLYTKHLRKHKAHLLPGLVHSSTCLRDTQHSD
jgi:hypothetical protein